MSRVRKGQSACKPFWPLRRLCTTTKAMQMRMDIGQEKAHLSSKDNTYEEIDLAFEGHKASSIVTNNKRSNSDSDLMRLLHKCNQEVEIIQTLLQRPMTTTSTTKAAAAGDVTFGLYEELEQGFYKCHDSIYDVPERQRIPDLKPTKAKIKAKNEVSSSNRRLSLDSGHGTSVADDNESHLDSSTLSLSLPSLILQRPESKASSKYLEDLNTSDALDRICGAASLESLPGWFTFIIHIFFKYQISSPTTLAPPRLSCLDEFCRPRKTILAFVRPS